MGEKGFQNREQKRSCQCRTGLAKIKTHHKILDRTHVHGEVRNVGTTRAVDLVVS